MKKFLSLLLALTMVMSLVVVPARADTGSGEGEGSGSGGETPAPTTVAFNWTEPTMSIQCNGSDVTSATKVKIGDTLSFTVSDLAVTKNGAAAESGTDYTVAYSWSGNGITSTGNTASVTAGAAGSLSATCTVTVTPNVGENETANPSTLSKVLSGSVTVTDPAAEANAAFKAEVAKLVQYAGRNATLSGNKFTAYKYSGDETPAWGFSATAIGTTYSNIAFSGTPAATGTGTMTVTGIKAGAPATPVTATFDFEVKTASFSIKRTPASGNTIAGAKVALATESAVLPNGLSYEWKYAKEAEASDDTKYSTISNTSASFDWTVPANLAAGNYVVKCTAKSGSTVVATAANALTVTVIADQWALFAGNSASLNTIYLAANQAKDLPTDIKLYVKNANGTKGDMVPDADVKYSWKVSNASALDINNNKVSAKTGASGTYAVTLTALYQGKEYTQSINVVVSNLTATLSAVSNGESARTYYISDMMSSACTLIAQRTNKNAASVTVSSLTFKSETNALGGSFSRTYATSSSGYITYTAPKAALGKAAITYTAVSNQGTFDIIYYIPVIPVATAFEAQYPQASTTTSWNNNYTYTVTAPSGYDRIALVNKTGSTPSVDSLAAPNLGNSSTITLNSSDFNSTTGKCTLYVIAWNSNYSYSYSNSSGKYYSGTLEVYLQNNDITYTGVAGSTVNFQHSSFTSFLNNTIGKNVSTYYQFRYVTFNNFNNANQGTLYYNNSAMSTYSGSNYFNSTTKIENLDNVSFAIKPNTTSKEIVIGFTLYAAQYNNNGTLVSSNLVPITGRVVINVAREDIVINVAAGDGVKLDASAFLNYLRSSSTAYRSSNIDYVTFEQDITAASTVNGALYTYYTNSYSFGNPVKSSDRFYYSTTTTYNVNRLSDVAFRANAYATTGTTVYIPFTIKLLNSNATVTGTLAAKITAAVNFVDVKTTDYFYDAVKWAVSEGVTKGTSATTFSPAKSCTRAEIVTFLWRAANSPAPKSYSNPFTDVNQSMGSDFYNAILWAVGEGITTGTSSNKFSPNAPCTRGQIVTFLHRYLKTPAGYYANPFKDVKSGYYCYNAVIWAYGSGVAKGSSATTFSPDTTCTRGDAVTFLYRALVK